MSRVTVTPLAFCDACERLHPAVIRRDGFNYCPGCLTRNQQADNELLNLPPEDLGDIRLLQRLAREAEEREAVREDDGPYDGTGEYGAACDPKRFGE